ncbi:MAG: c-type cytochrome [Emcibacteraceae bacterium]|nr:c-type cytochrome [Emcibacteraceae bacterium]MDG1859542.1 c-type cytochrome [Emcibacteraceae bacterium]
MFANQKQLIAFTAIATSLTFGALYANAQDKYGFGTSVGPDVIAQYDNDIHTDGKGLPEGSGNVALGREIFEYQCALCHGEKLEGVRAMGANSLHEGRRDIEKLPYASSLFDFIRRSMPLTDPGTLSDDETYGLVAFLLNETGVIKDPNLTLDAKSLADIKMPNRNNFLIDPASRFTAEDLADK